MNVKHSKLLLVASVIDTLFGAFYIICGLLEFTNALKTSANTITETIGIQLSYLVFASSIFLTATGAVSIVNNKTLKLINLRIFMGVISLAWPLFLSITLFFTLFQINIRLITMTLASLFFMTAVLIVKITNVDFSKGINFNPSAMISSTGKRAKSIDVGVMMNSSTNKLHQKHIVQTIENISESLKPNTNAGTAKINKMFAGKKKRGGNGMFKSLYNGKRRSINILSPLFKNRKRRRSRFRIR